MSTGSSIDPEKAASSPAAQQASDDEKAAVQPAKDLINNALYPQALEVLEGVLKQFPGSLLARQKQGLAYRRWGHLKDAETVFQSLYNEGHRDAETLGMYASTYMDSYDRTGSQDELRRSRDLYAEAFRLWPADFYTGVNAASKSVFLGERNRALDFAQEVQQVVDADLRALETGQKPLSRDDEYWLRATDAELKLIEENYSEAARLYRVALVKSPINNLGSQFSTWLQAKRLLRALGATEEQRDQIWQAFQHLADTSPAPRVFQPACRRLRVFAFDPSMGKHLETAAVNEVTLSVRWEADKNGESTLKPGPIGEYVEVVDCDPGSGCFYEPVNLDDHRLLAMDGLAPSEGDPKFHQQMVYAVSMNLIDHFERALGRRVLWASRDGNGAKKEEDNYVQRLRIYPHALREANAYYSPAKKALLLGYFRPEADDPDVYGPVFTCLSHDVVAHEMTHALLDGLHPHFTESSNNDVLAFHEAFADIVALFQHFSHSDVLLHEIGRTRSDLGTESLLGQLAQQFGRALGKRGALRDALGDVDPSTGKWRPRQPSPQDLQQAQEPHDRGAVLVAAVFDAFLATYRSRIADLLRVATQGTGILAPGALHPDLVRRLANEAAKTSAHYLRLCIRALDYCPPVDISFGDYLRAMITADLDFVPDDLFNYRLAILEGFQRRGIYPRDVRTLSMESLVWRPPRAHANDTRPLFAENGLKPEWRPTADRRALWESMRQNASVVQTWLDNYCNSEFGDELGLALGSDSPRSLYWRNGRPEAHVESVRVSRRETPDGNSVTNLKVEIVQRRRGYLDPERQSEVDEGTAFLSPDERGDFTFYGGCTLLIDPADCQIRFSITKHVLSKARLDLERNFRSGGDESSLRATYFGNPGDGQHGEPFALLHRSI